jgi:broad specificity phosphatase PhoE
MMGLVTWLIGGMNVVKEALTPQRWSPFWPICGNIAALEWWMAGVYFITHPEVAIDADIAVPDWTLSSFGRARMHRLLDQPWVSGLGAVWCSAERKARDGALILADAIGVVPSVLEGLGENDRSATGYLPKAAFEATADAFFARPEESIRGWERAVDAQRRIIAAIGIVLARSERDVAVVSHGGVGALLLCRLKGCAISRTEDQPGEGGGNYFCFDEETFSLRHGWLPIDGIPGRGQGGKV